MGIVILALHRFQNSEVILARIGNAARRIRLGNAIQIILRIRLGRKAYRLLKEVAGIVPAALLWPAIKLLGAIDGNVEVMRGGCPRARGVFCGVCCHNSGNSTRPRLIVK
jgi:hypothetical protein